MAEKRLLQFARLLGSNSVIGMAQKVGLNPPPPPISVRNLVSLATASATPLPPTDLKLFWDTNVAGQIVFRPPDSQSVPSEKNIQFDWRDPADSPGRKATNFQLHIRTAATGQEFDRSPFSLPSSLIGNFGISGLKPNTRYSWNLVPFNDFAQGPGSAVFTFQTSNVPTVPPPTPKPTPPPTRKGVSKLSFFNCRQDRNTLFIWVRDVTVPGTPFGLVAVMPTQTNSDGACPFDDNGLPVDPVLILDRLGAQGGLRFEDKHVYQIAIVDPDLPTCGGRNDPEQDNCLLQDQPFTVQADLDGDELILMISATIAPVPN